MKKYNPPFFLLCLAFFIQCKNGDSELEIPKTIHLAETHKLVSSENLDFITDFLFAIDESIWVGTFNSGIYHLSGNRILNFNSTNSALPNNRVNDLFIDDVNNLWIATDNGLAMLQNGRWEVYNSENTPLLSPRISQVVANGRNEVLIGSGDVVDGGLILRTQNGQWQKFSTENSSLPCNYILQIVLGNDQGFWVGTGQLLGQGGIAKFENQQVTDVLNIEKSGLLYNWVDNLDFSNDQLWTGFEVSLYNESGVPEGGIQHIDLQNQDIIDYFPNETGLVSNRITALKVQSDNAIWFATVIDDPACEDCFSGIGKLSQNNEFLIKSAFNSNLEPNAYFTKLSEDHHGNMYAASELTIYRLEVRKQ